MSEAKTKPTTVPVEDFLATVSEQRAKEAQELIRIMHEISGERPVMWGPSIIGFGSQHYKSEAGREGDMSVLGFSPRKAALTIYFYEGFNRYGKELSQLGKHKISQGCLYVAKLSDVDITVLQRMLQLSYAAATSPQQKSGTVEEYIDSVPAAARGQFDTLRSLVRRTLPKATEIVSYGVLGYKVDEKRARVFISGWKDHVAMYPLPKEATLREELAPYIRGKGTLWFTLNEPLPRAVIERAVRDLAE